MAEKRTRPSVNGPVETEAQGPVRGTAETLRTNVGSAVPASRGTGSDELLLRQILAELQRPNVSSVMPVGRQIDSDELLLLRQILAELQRLDQRLEAIERKLA